MPEDFLECERGGGRIITRKVGKGKYIRLCKDKKGEWHRGEVKDTKHKEEKEE